MCWIQRKINVRLISPLPYQFPVNYKASPRGQQNLLKMMGCGMGTEGEGRSPENQAKEASRSRSWIQPNNAKYKKC